MENPVLQAAMPDYFDPRIQYSEARVMHRGARHFREALRLERGVQMLPQMAKVSVPELVRSDFFNAVLRPGDVGDGAQLPLRTSAGQGVGVLWLFRREADPRFAPEEAAALGPLEPLLARALQPSEADAEDNEVPRHAHAPPSDERRCPPAPPGASGHQRSGVDRVRARIALPLQLLMQRLQWHAPDATRHSGAPWPHMEVRNAHGRFVLQAIPLNSAEGAGQAVAIHITQRVARSALLLAGLRAKGLPQRQHELAYWLARGLPESQVAARMEISVNTVVYHRRQLYARMGWPAVRQLRIP